MNVIIAANGCCQPKRFTKTDYLIAVDNGASYCLAAGQMPDLVIGDLDSIKSDTLSQLKFLNIPCKILPKEKDQTDLEAGLHHAIKTLSATKITVLNMTGGRDDMSLSNQLLLAHPDFCQYDIRLIGERQTISLITPERPFAANLTVGSTLSLVPISPEVTGVTACGVKYPLINNVLKLGLTRSLSNVVVDGAVNISLISGLTLVFYERS